ncbi:MAG: class I SAM-dependent methyltransferase [Deltaproteobacteria bacterium]|nr:class I SAM-dependent methyltransferase [Deltaproteobacteria bacterium]
MTDNNKNKTKTNEDFNNSKWARGEYAKDYIECADILIPERGAFFEVFKSFYTDYFLPRNQSPQVQNVLDLGSGDGTLIKELLEVSSNINATILDAGETMIEQAKQRFSGKEDFAYVLATFEELLDGSVEVPLPKNDKGFDLICSALAIHHIDANGKKALFSLIKKLLKKGGFFINMDTVLAPSKALEDFYLQLRAKRSEQKRILARISKDYCKFTDRHKDKEHHAKIDTLSSQMEMLETLGFSEVDCYFKRGIFAAYGGVKP